MNNINLGLLLCDTPIEIMPGLKLYQPTVRDVVLIGEEHYNLLLRIWLLKREQLITQETEASLKLNDFEIWANYMLNVPAMKEALEESCLIFFHKKIEFFPFSNTIYIGEGDTGHLLDLGLYLTLKTLFSKLDYTQSDKDSDNDQFKETQNMSPRERKIYERMKAGREKLEKMNQTGDKNDIFGKQIVGLVAIGHYTYKEVYDMTMLQFVMALRKYLDIQSYELRTQLSPYISSEDSKNQENKHWLD